MALRVDIPRDYLTRALDQAIASLRRSAVKQPNPLIKEMVAKDIAVYQKAFDTLTDAK